MNLHFREPYDSVRLHRFFPAHCDRLGRCCVGVEANKPEKELKAFAKTRELQPGETETVELKLPKAELASFDAAASAWVVTPGRYELLLGASSRDIRATLTVEAAAARTAVGDLLKPAAGLRRLERSGR